MRVPLFLDAPPRRSLASRIAVGALAGLAGLTALAGCGRLDDALSPGSKAPGAQAPAHVGLVAQLPSFSRAAAAGLRTQALYQRSDDSRVPIGTPLTVTIGDVASQQVPLSIDLATCLGDPLRKGADTGGGSECLAFIDLALVDGTRVVDEQIVGPLRLQAGATITLPDPVQLFEVQSVSVSPVDGVAPPAGSRVRVEVGGSAGLRAIVTSTTGQVVTGRAVQWTSDASGVARVDPVSGTVTGVALGRARVTASLGAGSGGIDLNVVPKPSAFVVGAGGGKGSGTIRSSPAGIDCHVVAGQPQNACSFTFLGDAQVTLTATADSGAVFGGWGPACTGASSGTTCTLDGSQTRNLSATFTALRQLAVGVSGTGSGTVSGGNATNGSTTGAPTIECTVGNKGTCSGTYLDGSTVMLSAAPIAPNTFVGWTGACAGTSGPQCSVTFSGDLVAGAQFAAPLGFSVLLSGTGGGSVTFTGIGDGPATCTLNRGSTPTGACTTTVPVGTTITLTATPNATSEFTGWTGLCTGTGPCTVRVADVGSVSAVFTQRMVNLSVTLRTGTLGNQGSVTAGAGVCALGGTATSTTCQFSVPAGAALTLTATPGTGVDFTGWSGCAGSGRSCTISPLTDIAVTATFGPGPLVLDVQGVTGGTGTGTISSQPTGVACTLTGVASSGACSSTFAVGAEVTLSASASPTSNFGGWGGACAGISTTTCTVTVSQAVTVTARFDLVTLALQVSTAGTGSGTVTGSPLGINCPGVCSANATGGTVVTLTATPNPGSSFGGWSGACSGTTPTCTVTMDVARSVTATFSAVVGTYPLSVATAGTGAGSVASSPSGISCPGTCSSSYPAGTTVTLTANAASGSTFAGWSGACSGTGSCVVTMSAARSVTATFNQVVTPPPTFTLSVGTSGTGSGSVTSSVGGIACPGTCSATFTSGTLVTLTAAPGPNSSFGGWSGACSGTGTCVVTMDAARSVTATFSAVVQTFSLSVATAGTGTGTVGSNPAGIVCPGTCSASYQNGTVVTLTAAPTNGGTFIGWSGACTGTGSCVVTMTAARSVTATFEAPVAPPPTFTLSVSTAGSGSGSVSSGPAGIACPSACSANFASGTLVTLSATPSAGSSFTGWSGACSGTGNCVVTMSAARSVTATFTAAPPTTFVLSVATAGTGLGTVSSSVGSINCPGVCSATYTAGTVVTLTASPSTASTFAGWSGACSGTGSCVVTMDAAKSVTATFTAAPPTTSRLTVSVTGPQGTGNVVSSPVGISCGPGATCAADFATGTIVTLTATPQPGASFALWTAGPCANSTAPSCTVTLNQATSVGAQFRHP